MTIYGLDGRPDAWILSRDGSGPSTRLLQAPPGWGTARAGAFSGDVELFVLSGGVEVDGHTLGPQTLWSARAGTMVDGMGSRSGGSMLIFSGAPLRFMPGEGEQDLNRPAPLVAGDREWTHMPQTPANARQRELGPSLRGGVFWQTAALDLSLDYWYVDEQPTEMFVLEGEWRQAHQGREGPDVVELPRGGYYHRPPGVWYGGTMTGTPSVALLLIRASPHPSRKARDPGEYPAHLR